MFVSAQPTALLKWSNDTGSSLIQSPIPASTRLAAASLLQQLDAEEKRLRRFTDAGTDSLEKRAKAVARLNEQLEKRRFALSLIGLGESDAIQARASREIDQLLAKAKEFPESAARIQETIARLSEATDMQLDRHAWTIAK